MNKYQPITSFTQRPSLAQIGSYTLFLLQVATFYAIIQVQFINSTAFITFHVLYGISLAGEIVTTIISSCIDPSDQFMIKYLANRAKTLNECEDMNSLLYCDLCRSYVKLKSKHCRVCGRCVENFDHHCMWINNCIGGKNYLSFFFMITFTFINMVLYLASIGVLWAQHQWNQYLAEMIVLWISGFIIIVFLILLFNLILLHIYLNCKGLTTFEFIIAQREEKRLQQIQEKMQEEEEKKKSNITLQELQKPKSQQFSQKKQEQNKTQENLNPKPIKNEEHLEEAKSQNQPNDKNKFVPIFLQREEQSQHDSQSLKISNFFTRNRSLKIFVADQVQRPKHRTILSQKAQKFYKSSSIYDKTK